MTKLRTTTTGIHSFRFCEVAGSSNTEMSPIPNNTALIIMLHTIFSQVSVDMLRFLFVSGYNCQHTWWFRASRDKYCLGRQAVFRL